MSVFVFVHGNYVIPYVSYLKNRGPEPGIVTVKPYTDNSSHSNSLNSKHNFTIREALSIIAIEVLFYHLNR